MRNTNEPAPITPHASRVLNGKDPNHRRNRRAICAKPAARIPYAPTVINRQGQEKNPSAMSVCTHRSGQARSRNAGAYKSGAVLIAVRRKPMWRRMRSIAVTPHRRRRSHLRRGGMGANSSVKSHALRRKTPRSAPTARNIKRISSLNTHTPAAASDASRAKAGPGSKGSERGAGACSGDNKHSPANRAIPTRPSTDRIERRVVATTSRPPATNQRRSRRNQAKRRIHLRLIIGNPPEERPVPS